MNLDFEYFVASIGACVEVDGEDASSFLQSQFSNDLSGGVGSATYGLWLDHRGRMHADSTVLQIGPERFLLFSWASDAASIIRKLSAHIVADDVTLTDRTEGFQAVALRSGELAWAGIEANRFGIEFPEEGRFSEREGCYVFRARPGPTNAWIVMGKPEAVAPVVADLEKKASPMKPARWHAARIEAGRPLVPTEVGPAETPLEAGLETSCSWTKGCFLGQEVIARQRRLGRQNRRLVRVRIEGTLPSGLLPIDLCDGENVVGNLRAAGGSGDGEMGLAMIKMRLLEGFADRFLTVKDEPIKVWIDGE